MVSTFRIWWISTTKILSSIKCSNRDNLPTNLLKAQNILRLMLSLLNTISNSTSNSSSNSNKLSILSLVLTQWIREIQCRDRILQVVNLLVWYLKEINQLEVANRQICLLVWIWPSTLTNMVRCLNSRCLVNLTHLEGCLKIWWVNSSLKIQW